MLSLIKFVCYGVFAAHRPIGIDSHSFWLFLRSMNAKNAIAESRAAVVIKKRSSPCAGCSWPLSGMSYPSLNLFKWYNTSTKLHNSQTSNPLWEPANLPAECCIIGITCTFILYFTQVLVNDQSCFFWKFGVIPGIYQPFRLRPGYGCRPPGLAGVRRSQPPCPGSQSFPFDFGDKKRPSTFRIVRPVNGLIFCI